MAGKTINMRMILKGAVAALALAGTMLATTGTADAQNYNHYNRHRHYHHNRDNSVLSLVFGNVAYGYNDGYWDNNHSWHRWSNDGEYRNYRQYGSNYHDWRHDRDGDHGWQRH